jgi:acetyltransferase-like isoleucine patch superfamily enzyme
VSIPIGLMLTIGLLPSPLKVAYYRLRGARIGRRVRIGPLSVIRARSIVIGDDASIGFATFVSLREDLELGKRSQIKSMVAIDTGSLVLGEDSIIMEQVLVGGILTPRSHLRIGKRVKVFPFSFLNPTREITIEDDVGVGGASYIFTHGSWQNVLDGFSANFAPVTIKRNAWLAWRVFVSAGVTIGEDAIVTPHSVVRESVPDGGLATGVPAKPVDLQWRHVRKLTAAHKLKLLADILVEFAEHESWSGRKTVILSRDGSGIMLSHPEGGILVTAIWDDSQHEVCTVISMARIPPEERDKLVRRNVGWFDIESKQASLARSGVNADVRAFLSRYGIRFDLIGD